MIRARVGRASPAIAVSSVRTQEAVIAAQTVRERLLAILGAFFAAVALVLSAVGLYGVADYLVVQRRRDIGICLALGAPTTRVARMVVSGIVAMVALGGGVGLVLGLGSERYLAALLFGVTATDSAASPRPAGIVTGRHRPRVRRANRARPADRHHGDDPATVTCARRPEGPREQGRREKGRSQKGADKTRGTRTGPRDKGQEELRR